MCSQLLKSTTICFITKIVHYLWSIFLLFKPTLSLIDHRAATLQNVHILYVFTIQMSIDLDKQEISIHFQRNLNGHI